MTVPFNESIVSDLAFSNNSRVFFFSEQPEKLMTVYYYNFVTEKIAWIYKVSPVRYKTIGIRGDYLSLMG